MAETHQLKSPGSDGPGSTPFQISESLIEHTQSFLESQAELLGDVEQTMVASLHRQRDSVNRVLGIMDDLRHARSLTDQVKMQLAASQECLTSGLNLWTDATALLSHSAMKRLQSGARTAQAMSNTIVSKTKETQRKFASKIEEAAD